MRQFALIALALSAAPASAAVTFDEAYVDTSAFALPDGNTSDHQPDRHYTIVNTLPAGTVTTSAAQDLTRPAGQVTATSSASMAFVSAAQGSARLGGYAVSTDFTDGSLDHGGGSANAIFDYTFTIDRASRLDIGYVEEVVRAQMPAGINYFFLLQRSGQFDSVFEGHRSGNGAVSIALDVAGTYDLFIDGTLYNFLYEPGSLNKLAGATNFSFNITAVPEAATWAMMIAGFGLIGASTRRRRTLVIA